MALLASIRATPISSLPLKTQTNPGLRRLPVACLSSSSSHGETTAEASHSTSSSTAPTPFVDPIAQNPDAGFKYELASEPSGNTDDGRLARFTESTVERVIFDFRFLALLAVGGSLAGSLLCFLNGCVYIVDAYKVYWTSCIKGVHTGKMVLRLVEAIDVYLAGTVMLIFGMGLYGLFISNVPPGLPSNIDRALLGSSLFGMFALKERPKWMKISSLDELKTKVGHVIVMILLVKMFERSKMVTIATGLDLLSYSVCIFLSSASLYILHNLHK
ncbi:uncharacterized protein LOC103716445 [Phoenix dactylifera]|uniref:Uncharacterized protein LOC103716445 n=1 Tax=Phoenix dactylifera TaxID=42345 RepID=A0A8B7CMZ2_PHODC|nr:uncharacterized protein LOC103716445 [Phoenix dactylifera]